MSISLATPLNRAAIAVTLNLVATAAVTQIKKWNPKALIRPLSITAFFTLGERISENILNRKCVEVLIGKVTGEPTQKKNISRFVLAKKVIRALGGFGAAFGLSVLANRFLNARISPKAVVAFSAIPAGMVFYAPNRDSNIRAV